jgi:cytochrome P450
LPWRELASIVGPVNSRGSDKVSEQAVQQDIDHIPPELVWEGKFDEFTSHGDDPFLAITRFHKMPPVFWATEVSYGQPGWICTDFDTISEVFQDHEHFSGERHSAIASLVGEPVRLNPIEIDPPAHHGYRRNLNPVFTPKAMGAVLEAVRDTCGSLIAKFEDKGGCEFVKDFAIPFPTYVFLDLMALPRDRAGDFIAWEDRMMRSPDNLDRAAAAQEIYKYLCGHKDREKANPSNEVNRAITQGTFEGRPLDHYEMMGMYYVLWAGGLDTVYSTLGWIMRHLATHPELQDRLRADPDLLGPAVEEFARAFSVVVTHRTVVDDFVFRGAPLKKGDPINLPISLANRDPSVFADPHTVDIDRNPRHINFGTGAHTCLGVHLAKRELRTVVEEFLKRFRNIRIKEGDNYRYHTGRTFGMDYLPLEWDRV